MKNLINISAILIVLFFAACTNSVKPSEASADTAKVLNTAALYTCPMHPEVISEMPGTCPDCKMDLIEKTDTVAPADSIVRDSSNHTENQH
jgi:hypothetical protein